MVRLPSLSDAGFKALVGQMARESGTIYRGSFLDDQAATESVSLEPGSEYPILVEAGDLESEFLSIEWVVMEESRAKEIGGDLEIVPATLSDLVEAASAETILRAPKAPEAFYFCLRPRSGRKSGTREFTLQS